jgi:hypothetical protein
MTSARRAGQHRYAAEQLERALHTIRCAGGGNRNITLSREAFAIFRLVGGGLLHGESAEAALVRAGLACGLSRAEVRATLKNAAKGVASPAFAGEPANESFLTQELSDVTFDAVVRRIAELCPIESQPDVSRYVWSRGLPLTSGGGFALPPVAEQNALIATLAAQFGRATLVATGLLKRCDDGAPDLSRFAWPGHRWCIPWRSPEGQTQTLERRAIGSCGNAPRWVFAAGRGAMWPLGAEMLWPAWQDRDRPVVIAEGPGDTLALRAAELTKFSRTGAATGVRPFIIGLPSAMGLLSPGTLRVCIGHKVHVALDSDAAGENAARAIMRQLEECRTEAVRMAPPAPAKDWGEALVRHLRRHAAHASELEAERAERAAIQAEGRTP